MRREGGNSGENKGFEQGTSMVTNCRQPSISINALADKGVARKKGVSKPSRNSHHCGKEIGYGEEKTSNKPRY